MKQTVSAGSFTGSRAQLNSTIQGGKTNILMWLLISAMLLLSLTAIAVRGAAVEWLVATLSIAVFVASYICPRVAAKDISLERAIASQVVDDEEVVIGIELKRKWRIPGIWYATLELIYNESEQHDEPFKLQQHYEPLFSKAMTQHYALQNLSRGHYKSQTVVVLIGDVLGLTTIKRVFELPLSFTVMPIVLPEQEQTYLSHLTAQKWSSQHANEQSPKKNERVVPLYEQNSGHINGIKPYSEGDSIHRIYYHALSRGMGVHVLEEKEQLSTIKQVIFIDQYVPPMSYELAKQQFNTLIGWTLDRVSKQLANGPNLIVTDNWCYECYELFQLEELRRLLAQIKPDVQYSITERLLSLAKILPSHCALKVYTTDWKNSEGWTELSQLAWHKRATVSLQLLSDHRIMTYSMREQQRELEQSGLQLEWRFSNYTSKQLELTREGSETYAFNV